MNFAEAVKDGLKWSYTENGERALNTTSDACLNLFSVGGALRKAEVSRKETLFEEAYKEDPLLATKILFYLRDIRGGLGERQTFRDIIYYCANHHPEALENNINLFGEYGRWDDIYSLVGTTLESKMWDVVREIFSSDLNNLQHQAYNKITLLAKWLKTPDASSEKTAKLGRYTAHKLGYELVRNFTKDLRDLRKALKIVERDMSANRWNEINYSAVPSKASMLYRNAFQKHDEVRYSEFLDNVNKGTAKINASTLYPYDIVGKYLPNRASFFPGDIIREEDATVEALWKALPSYVEPNVNALVIADTSGSMFGTPLNSALGLAIYFAEHNTGIYHGLWMNFSTFPSFQKIKGSSLNQILKNVNYDNWSGSTDLEAAFDLILKTAVENHILNDEMVKSLIVISDMEIDYCTGDSNWTFYDKMKERFESYGYTIPQIIFWNVESRHDIFLADGKRKGTILCSGHSASTFKNLINTIGLTPKEFMLKVINSERYNSIRI